MSETKSTNFRRGNYGRARGILSQLYKDEGKRFNISSPDDIKRARYLAATLTRPDIAKIADIRARCFGSDKSDCDAEEDLKVLRDIARREIPASQRARIDANYERYLADKPARDAARLERELENNPCKRVKNDKTQCKSGSNKKVCDWGERAGCRLKRGLGVNYSGRSQFKFFSSPNACRNVGGRWTGEDCRPPYGWGPNEAKKRRDAILGANGYDGENDYDYDNDNDDSDRYYSSPSENYYSDNDEEDEDDY